jgi:hypothetical protein
MSMRKAVDPQNVGQSHIDPEGDLRLEVGKEKVSFIVCARTLARASPVFKAMLFGQFKEAKPAKGLWVVALPEDHPEGLRILLNVVHNNYPAVPRFHGLSFAVVKGLAVMADKYDMVPLTRPWAKTWQNELRKASDAVAANCGQLLWISWVFGFEAHFKATVEYLTRASFVGALYSEPTANVKRPKVQIHVKGWAIKEDDQLQSVEILGRLLLLS